MEKKMLLSVCSQGAHVFFQLLKKKKKGVYSCVTLIMTSDPCRFGWDFTLKRAEVLQWGQCTAAHCTTVGRWRPIHYFRLRGPNEHVPLVSRPIMPLELTPEATDRISQSEQSHDFMLGIKCFSGDFWPLVKIGKKEEVAPCRKNSAPWTPQILLLHFLCFFVFFSRVARSFCHN